MKCRPFTPCITDLEDHPDHQCTNEVIQPIRYDRLKGMRYTQIAEKYRIDPRTAKRYAEKNLSLDELEHRVFSSVLDPYKSVIQRWLVAAPLSAREVWLRLVSMGCRCGYTIVNDYVKKIRPEPNVTLPTEPQ